MNEMVNPAAKHLTKQLFSYLVKRFWHDSIYHFLYHKPCWLWTQTMRLSLMSSAAAPIWLSSTGRKCLKPDFLWNNKCLLSMPGVYQLFQAMYHQTEANGAPIILSTVGEQLYKWKHLFTLFKCAIMAWNLSFSLANDCSSWATICSWTLT